MDCSRCGLPVPDRRTGDWKRPDVHEPPEECLEYLKQEVRRLGSHEAEALLRMKRAEEEAVGLRAWVAAYLGDATDKTARGEIANTGAKMPRNMAEGLFPQIVAAGYEWWD